MVTRVGHPAPICSKVLGRARWEVAARVPHRSATAPHHHRLSGPTGPVGSRPRPGVVGGGVVARNAPPHPQNSDFGDPRTRNARHFAGAYPPQTALARALEGEAVLLNDTSRSATAGRGVATWPLATAKTCAHPRYTSARGPHKGSTDGTFVPILQWRLPLCVRGHDGPARSLPWFPHRFPAAHHHKHRVVALDLAVCSPATRGAQRDHGSTITGIAGANLFEV